MSSVTERSAIKQRMQDIKEERRQLHNEYYELLDRLRELDSYEREAIDTEGIMGNLIHTVQILSQLTPTLPVEDLFERTVKKAVDSGMSIEVKEVQEDHNIVPSHVVQEQMYTDSLRALENKPEKKKATTRTNSKKFTERIVEIMKIEGIPLRLSDIKQFYQNKYDEEILDGTFFNRLTKAMEIDNKLQKVSRGFYQYKM